MVGSTDAHTSLSTTTEDNFFGKVVPLEPSADPIRFEEVIAGRFAPKGSQLYARETSASGLAAVWATDNTREALWDAMARKEVYATTGTRLTVRVFGGYDLWPTMWIGSDFAEVWLPEAACRWAATCQERARRQGAAFLIRAMRDADGANLDRIQVIKGWLDANGETHEKVLMSPGPATASRAQTASCPRSATP